MIVDIWTDGSCEGNPGKGGWAFVALNKEKGKHLSRSGFLSQTTNNRAEMIASIEALKSFLSFDVEIILYSDSMYLINGITKWIKGWKKNNWKDGQIKNIDLWKELDSLNQNMKVTWQWVKGHDGDIMNERVNYLAQSETKNGNKFTVQ